MKRTIDGTDVAHDKDRRRKCPYLDTVNRHMLDFDLEKICSITLSNQNIYMCLVCGKLFQGRGRNTHAYTHSVDASHHVFINMHNGKIYCLPDNYEVIDSSLDDIRKALRPTFTSDQISKLSANKNLAHDVFGVAYLPGFVGLNNLKNTDFVNVTIQALAHVIPLRNYFLVPENYEKTTTPPCVVKFGEIIRKLWSPGNFKSTVSPHELVEEITVASGRRFKIGEQNEVIHLMTWLLNYIHQGIGGTKKAGSSIIHEVFQGEVEVLTELDEKNSTTSANENIVKDPVTSKNWSSARVPFMHLSLDLPATPLFKDSQGGNIIPQIPLFEVLKKFDGEHITDELRAGVRHRKRYRLRSLPKYLVLHLKRFTKNNFFTEKNPTIVNFPIKNFELRDYLFADAKSKLPALEEVSSLSIAELRTLLSEKGVSTEGCLEKADLEEKLRSFITTSASTKYDLVANICHDSPTTIGKEANTDPLQGGNYRIHVFNKATNQWYEIQDLHVRETLPQLIGLSESYLMIYGRQDANQ